MARNDGHDHNRTRCFAPDINHNAQDSVTVRIDY